MAYSVAREPPLAVASNNTNTAPTPAFHYPQENFKMLETNSESPYGLSSVNPFPAAPSTPPSPPKLPLTRLRARTSSSKLLHCLTSLGSNFDASTSSTPPASPTSDTGKIDKAALSRAKGKYKSSVNWESSNVALPTGEVEPFMEVEEVSGSSTLERDPVLVAADDEMLAAGGTAAAKAYYTFLNSSYASAIFPAQKRAFVEAKQRATAESAVGRSVIPMSAYNQRRPRTSLTPASSSGRYSNGDRLSSLNTAVHTITAASASSPSSPVMTSSQQSPCSPSTGPPSAWRRPTDQSTQDPEPANFDTGMDPTADKHLQSQMASSGSTQSQQQLQPQTASRTGLQPPAASTNPSASPERDPKKDGIAQPPPKSISSSFRTKRRSFLGLTSKSSDGLDKAGRKAMRSSMVSKPRRADSSVDNTTGGRRRRYQDTRELDLLAAELAREAAIEAFGLQDVSPVAASSSTNIAHGGPNEFQTFAPAFSRENPMPQTPSNTNRPRSISHSLEPAAGLSPTGSRAKTDKDSQSPVQSQSVSNIPTEMLTGLSDGPYPMLPIQDPQMGEGLNSGYSTPRRSRVGSFSATTLPLPSNGGSAITSSKRSVLSMSMHDPDSELQGLTKVTKSGKSTPFGSRAPSRNVTPKNSFSKLNEATKQQQQKQPPPQIFFLGQQRRSLAEDTDRSESSHSHAGTVNAPTLPTPVQEVSKAQEEEGMGSRSASTQGTLGQMRPVDRTDVPSSSRPGAWIGHTSCPPNESPRQSSGDLSLRPSLIISSERSSKFRGRLSFFGTLRRGNKNAKAATRHEPVSSVRVATGNKHLTPPSTSHLRTSPFSSTTSLSSHSASHRSSTFASQTTGARDSGTSLTGLTPSSETSQGSANAMPKQISGNTRFEAGPTPETAAWLIPTMPDRPVRSAERPSTTGKDVRMRTESGPGKPVVKGDRSKGGSDASSSTRTSATSGGGSSARKARIADEQVTKRPGNLRRLLSKFGSNGKVAKVSSRPVEISTLPTNATMRELSSWQVPSHIAQPGRIGAPTSTAARRTESPAPALAAPLSQYQSHLTRDVSSSTDGSTTSPAAEYNVKVVYSTSAGVISRNDPAGRAEQFLQAASAVSVGR